MVERYEPNRFATEGLTIEEDRQLVQLLAKWKGGKISTPVFTELAQMIPQPIVEVVLFRTHERKLETLLIPRPENDIVWPGKFHTPGTAMRKSDFLRVNHEPLEGAFERIQKDELLVEFATKPRFAGRLYRLGDRGAEIADIFFAELPPESNQPHHLWYPVDELKYNQNFIQGQLEHVMMAAKEYEFLQ